jgi:methylglutaconyl-CoA hydratase
VEDLVLMETRGSTAVLKLNRPDKRNALSRALISALTEKFGQVRDRNNIRSVILTGAGSTFCAGMDLAELSETID